MTWIQWLKGAGQPTGPTLTKRRIRWARDTTNEAIYFFEWTGSNSTTTIYKLWVDGFTITLDTFSGPTLSHANDRVEGLFVIGGDVVLTGTTYTALTYHATAWHATAPLTGTPSWTKVTSTDANGGSGMAYPTPSCSDGSPWCFNNGKLAAGNSKSYSKLATVIHGDTGGGSWTNGVYRGWSCAVSATRSLYAYAVASGNSIAAYWMSETGQYQGGTYQVSRALTTASLNGTSLDDMMQAFLIGDKACIPFRDAGGQFHVAAFDESARTAADGRVNADLRGGLEYDAGAGAKGWAVNASTKAMYSSADGVTWAADTDIDNYPGADNPAVIMQFWTGEMAILGSGGELWVLDLAVPAPPEEPTDERAAFKRMGRDSSNPGAIGFLSDHLTLTASSEHARYPAENLQSFAYYGPNRPPEVGRTWRSLVDTSVALDWDTGVSSTDLALALFFLEGQKSLGLDVLDFDVTITVLTGATSPPTSELFDLVLSPSTGNWSRKAKDLTISRYVRFLIEGAAGAGGGPVGFFQAARAFFTDLQHMVTNYSNAKFSESDVGVSTPAGSVRKKLLAMDFELVGAESGDTTVWNQLRGSSRERDFHLQPNIPMVFDPDPTGSLDPDGVGHFGPRCCWLRSGEPGFNKAIPTADGIYSSRLELVSL